MKRIFIFVCLAALMPALAICGDAGVLIPRDKQQPNPAVLSLEEMEITVRIDNGDARVFVRQIFANHTAANRRRETIFLRCPATRQFPISLPGTALCACPRSFSNANGRKKSTTSSSSRRSIRVCLQMGERGAEEAKRSSVFSARITPIPAYGTKRLEIEYHEAIPVENLKSYFAIPLRPDAYQRRLRPICVSISSCIRRMQFATFSRRQRSFPLQLDQNTTHLVRGHFEGEEVNLAEDFVATYDLDPAGIRHVAGC